MSGRFQSASVAFQADDGFTAVDLPDPQLVVDETLGEALPEGPKDSWLAARLTHLVGGSASLFPSGLEIEPDGLLIADLLALDAEDKVLAKVQLQAGPAAAAAGVVAKDAVTAETVRSALMDALLAGVALADVEVFVSQDEATPARRVGRMGGVLLTED